MRVLARRHAFAVALYSAARPLVGMSRRPATITQADTARIIRAAKQAGATEVEIRVGEAVLVVRLNERAALDPGPRIVL
jgi:hypothetical protein